MGRYSRAASIRNQVKCCAMYTGMWLCARRHEGLNNPQQFVLSSNAVTFARGGFFVVRLDCTAISVYTITRGFGRGKANHAQDFQRRRYGRHLRAHAGVYDRGCRRHLAQWMLSRVCLRRHREDVCGSVGGWRDARDFLQSQRDQGHEARRAVGFVPHH